MNHPLSVGSAQGLGDLPTDLQRLVDRHRTFRDFLCQRLPLDQFQDQSANADGLFQPIDPRDIGVSQRSQYLSLPLKTSQSFLIAGERLRQNLNRHLPSKLRVRGAINLSHPSGAKLAGDLVMS